MKKADWASRAIVAIALMSCVVFPVFGQTTPGNHSAAQNAFEHRYYHLVFVVKEVEAGKVINSRNYFMSIGTVENSSNGYMPRSIRTGTKVPVEAEPGKISYVDVGINIDCRSVVDLGDRMAMDLSAEINSVQRETEDRNKPQTTGLGATPSIQQNKWNSQVVVFLGKPTVVFSSDEVTSKRTIELELTATEIK
jgi:hypothetical protein